MHEEKPMEEWTGAEEGYIYRTRSDWAGQCEWVKIWIGGGKREAETVEWVAMRIGR